MIYALLAAALAVALWPSKPKPLAFPGIAPDAPKPRHSYAAAIHALAAVRARLVETEELGDGQKAAIDTLTLALVAGSDRE